MGMKIFTRKPAIKILAALITGFVSLYFTSNYFRVFVGNALTKFLEASKITLKTILQLLNFGVPIWALLILAVVFFTIRYFVTFSPATILSTPDFLEYKSGVFRGKVKWEWEYQKNYQGKYDVINLNPSCPSCSTPMIMYINHFDAHADCPRCTKRILPERKYADVFLENPSDIKAIIIDNIKRELYSKNN